MKLRQEFDGVLSVICSVIAAGAPLVIPLVQVVLIAGMGLVYPKISLAAEIEIRRKAIYIQGEIVKGDLDKFEDAIRKLGPNIASVVLRASPGGDLESAMKIGSIIRRLKLTTDVAILGAGGPIIDLSWPPNADGSRKVIIGTDSDAMCASACFFIWIAGFRRQGDYLLIVHRPYFDPAEFSQLDSDQAQLAYANLENVAYSYLEAMGTPRSVIDLMRRTSSGDGARLDADFVAQEVSPMSADIDEWLRSKCGGFSPSLLGKAEAWSGQAPRDLWQEMGLVRGYSADADDASARSAADEKVKCVSDILATERDRAWQKAYGQ